MVKLQQVLGKRTHWHHAIYLTANLMMMNLMMITHSTCKDDMTFDLDNKGAQERVDEFFSHVSNASRPCGVTPEHLSKVWHISPEDARRTIDTTTQTSVQTQDPTLSCNYGTNDRMLRY